MYDVPTWLRFYVIGPWLLIPLGLVGLVFGTPSLRKPLASLAASAGKPGLQLRSDQLTGYLIWVSFVPCYAAAVAMFLISERYRLPLLVPLIVGAGGAIDDFVTRITARKISSLAAPLAALIVLGVLLNTRTIANDGRWSEGLRMAHQLVVIGHYDEAESWVDRLEASAPHNGMVHDSVGRQYLLAKQPARALPHLTQGLGAASSQEDWLLVGRLTAELTTADAAEPFFRHAVGMNPNQPAARQQYGLNLLVLNRMDDAARELGEAVRLDPRNAASLSNLAYCEAKLGRMPDARRHVAAALAIDPSDAMALQLAAVLR